MSKPQETCSESDAFSESDVFWPEDLRMFTPSSGSSEAAKETTSPADVHQAMASLLTFANQLNESTSQLFDNLTRFKETAAAPVAAEIAKCKEKMDRLKLEVGVQRERIRVLEAERREFQIKIFDLEECIAEARRPTFQPDHVGFFDPDLSVKEYGPGDVVCKGGISFYRKVEPFLDAAFVALWTTPAAIVRENLHLCLMGSARTWYASVLSYEERDKIASGKALHNWTAFLRRKWNRAAHKMISVPNDGLKELERMILTPEGIRGGTTSPTEFIIAAVRAARRIGIEATYPQLILAYMRIDPRLRPWFGIPDANCTVNEFIIQVDQVVASYMERHHKSGLKST